MIHYINKPKIGSLFFLNQVVLLFSILFFGSSCFEGIIKNKGKKPYEYKESITSQRLNERLNKTHNHFMDHLDKGRDNYFKKYIENQKAAEACIRTGFQEAIRREINVPSLSEEEKKYLQTLAAQEEQYVEILCKDLRRQGIDLSFLSEEEKEGLQKAVEEFIRTVCQKAIREIIALSFLSEEGDDVQKAIEESIKTGELEEEALYINRVQEELIRLKEKQVDIEHINYIIFCLQQYIIASNKEDKIYIKRMLDDYIDVVKEDEEILPSLAQLQVSIRGSRPPVMSKKELIKKLKERFGDPVTMTEDCPICFSDTPSDSEDPSDFYTLPCCNNTVVHIACIARSAGKKYYDTAGDPKCNEPKYECAFCRRSLL